MKTAVSKVVLVPVTAVAGLLLVGWLGLKVNPAPFAGFPQQQPELDTIPLPAGLPAPVERYYRKLYGDRVPVVTSAVITGRAQIRPVPGGPTFPARFRFSHVAGQDYRHYIEATVFGLPVMKVNESYLDGKDRQELPWATVENSPKADQAGNLGMWAESAWFPALFLTDPRVSWEAVDSATALLVVPFGKAEERYVVRFDPETGLVRLFESMRYKGTGAGPKTLWLNESLEYRRVDGFLLGAVGSATWLDDGKPWATFTVESVVYNVNVKDYVRGRGL